MHVYNKLITEVTKRDDLEACHEAWVMYVSGLRPMDVSRLWNDSVFIKLTKGEPNSLTILARWTKGIRKVKNRRQICYPLKGLVQPPEKLLDRLNTIRNTKLTRVWRHYSAGKTNDMLDAITSQLNLKRITSGSLRRAFSERIEEHCKSSGIPKADMMLHVSESMDKAHYAFDKVKD